MAWMYMKGLSIQITTTSITDAKESTGQYLIKTCLSCRYSINSKESVFIISGLSLHKHRDF